MNSNLTEQDKAELLESAGLLIESLIDRDPIIFMQPDFDETTHKEISQLLIDQTFGMCEPDDIDNIVTTALATYYTHVYPRRSYNSTFIHNEPIVKNISPHLQLLRDIPQPEQRTTEWYAFRHNYITASSAWKAFVSDSTRNQIIYDKCKPHDPDKYSKSVTVLDSPLQWGVRYEPVSILWYEKLYSTIIEDFGCIPHPKLNCLAASPDGINCDPNSSRYGRMLEVKNIVNREITGIPKLEYWVQMQLQMEVCDLNECDFLETRFKEYNSFQDFTDDGTFTRTADGKHKGIILYFNDNENSPIYEYPPFDIQKDEYDKWEVATMKKHKNITWISNMYWYLDEVSCILVMRNKLWFTAAKTKLKDIWKTIEYDRKHGHEHRAPRKKNSTKSKTSPTINPSSSGCFIDTNSLFENNNNNKIITIKTECLEE